MKILIHACCGPCLIVPYFELQGQGDLTAYFFNPNIHPSKEYQQRLDTFKQFCQEENIEYIIEIYEPQLYFDNVDYHLPEGERCADCYQLRLKKAAKYASDNGFEALTTTMLGSPYQNFEKIIEAGLLATKNTNVDFLALDFRPNYRNSIEESKKRNMYRQGYCGCLFSETERYYHQE